MKSLLCLLWYYQDYQEQGNGQKYAGRGEKNLLRGRGQKNSRLARACPDNNRFCPPSEPIIVVPRMMEKFIYSVNLSMSSR